MKDRDLRICGRSDESEALNAKGTVLTFIQRRWPDAAAHWTDGNCYWFAQILIMRFPWLELYYMPTIGHFVAGAPPQYYDANGLNTEKDEHILFSTLARQDPAWADRILRDCRD